LVGVDLLGGKDQHRMETLRIQGTLELMSKRVRAEVEHEENF